LWNVSGKIERDGVVTQWPTRTRCVTPENSKKYSQQVFPPAEFSGHDRTCKIFNLENSNKEVSWQMQRFIPRGKR
jgi:hypothetical protein